MIISAFRSTESLYVVQSSILNTRNFYVDFLTYLTM